MSGTLRGSGRERAELVAQRRRAPAARSGAIRRRSRAPGLLHAAFVRSRCACAADRIDAAAARAMPGVHAVLTYADLRPLLTGDRIPQAIPTGAIRFHVDPFALARDELCYVGEPLALVVAATGASPKTRRPGRARARASARGDRSARRVGAGRGQGAARLPGQSGGTPPHRLRRCRCRLRRRGASVRGAFPARQRRRPFDRDARPHRRSTGDGLRVAATPRCRIAPKRCWRGARPRRASGARHVPATGGGFGPKAASIPRSWRCRGGDAPAPADQMDRGPA